MNRIDDLLTTEAEAIRENADLYDELKPEYARKPRTALKICFCALLATAAGLGAVAMFRPDATQDPMRENAIAYSELEQLAVETVQWAERVAERKQHSRQAGRVKRQLRDDGESLRRLLNAFSTFGREKDNQSNSKSELTS